MTGRKHAFAARSAPSCCCDWHHSLLATVSHASSASAALPLTVIPATATAGSELRSRAEGRARSASKAGTSSCCCSWLPSHQVAISHGFVGLGGRRVTSLIPGILPSTPSGPPSAFALLLQRSACPRERTKEKGTRSYAPAIEPRVRVGRGGFSDSTPCADGERAHFGPTPLPAFVGTRTSMCSVRAPSGYSTDPRRCATGPGSRAAAEQEQSAARSTASPVSRGKMPKADGGERSESSR